MIRDISMCILFLAFTLCYWTVPRMLLGKNEIEMEWNKKQQEDTYTIQWNFPLNTMKWMEKEKQKCKMRSAKEQAEREEANYN